MAEDFFANIGKTILQVTSTAVDKTEDFFAITKIKGRMAEESRMIDQLCRNIGLEVYDQYVNGQAFSESIAELCKDIERHKTIKKEQEKDLALLRNRKTQQEDIFETEE